MALLGMSDIFHIFAYLDPGTGSYLFQIAIAAMLGAAVTIKTYWKRITIFIQKRFKS